MVVFRSHGDGIVDRFKGEKETRGERFSGFVVMDGDTIGRTSCRFVHKEHNTFWPASKKLLMGTLDKEMGLSVVMQRGYFTRLGKTSAR